MAGLRCLVFHHQDFQGLLWPESAQQDLSYMGAMVRLPQPYSLRARLPVNCLQLVWTLDFQRSSYQDMQI
jgi:hypothetical protein